MKMLELLAHLFAAVVVPVLLVWLSPSACEVEPDPEPVPVIVSQTQANYMQVFGTYGPTAATLTCYVYKQGTQIVLAKGLRDMNVVYPDFCFTYPSMQGNAVTIVIIATWGGQAIVDSADYNF